MRKIRLFLLSLLICAILTLPAFAVEAAGLRSAWTVSDSGDLLCELAFTCRFSEPEEKFHISLPEGAEKITVYNLRSDRKGTEVDILAETAFLGEHTFRLSYRLPTGLLEADGQQSLVLPLVPKGFGLPVSYVEFTLTLPKDYQNEPILTIGETRTTEAVYTLDTGKIVGSLQAPVASGSGLTLTMDLGADYFGSDVGMARRIFASWRVSLVALLLLIVAYWYVSFFRGSRRPKAAARAMPPDGAASADLPCLLYGGSGDVAALLTEWAELGYVAFTRERGGRFTAHALMNMGSERRSFESRLFARLFGQSAAVRVGSPQWNAVVNAAASQLGRHWQRSLFDSKSGSPMLLRCLCALFGALGLLSGTAGRGVAAAIFSVPLGAILAFGVQLGTLTLLRRGTKLAIAAGAASALVLVILIPVLSEPLLLVVLALQILCGFALCFGGRRSKLGAELLDQTLSYRRHLLRRGRKLRAISRDSRYFYRTLPYAQALGCAAAFAAGFGDAELEPCSWLDAEPEPTAFASAYLELIRQLHPDQYR